MKHVNTAGPGVAGMRFMINALASEDSQRQSRQYPSGDPPVRLFNPHRLVPSQRLSSAAATPLRAARSCTWSSPSLPTLK